MPNAACLMVHDHVDPFTLFTAAQDALAEQDVHGGHRDHTKQVWQHELWIEEYGYAGYGNTVQGLPGSLSVYYPTRTTPAPTTHVIAVPDDAPAWEAVVILSGGSWTTIAVIGAWCDMQGLSWSWSTDSDGIIHDGPDKLALIWGEAPYPAR